MLYAEKIIDRHLDELQLIEMAAFYSRLHFTLTDELQLIEMAAFYSRLHFTLTLGIAVIFEKEYIQNGRNP